MEMRKFLLALLVGVFCVVNCAVAADKPVHLTLAHADPESGSLFGECTKEFKRLVEEKTNGSVIIDIYPNGQLGTVPEYIVGLQSGSLDLAPAASTFIANFCTSISVFDMPFLFESYEHAWKTLDGEVGQILDKELRENGLIPLIWYGIGFRNITTSPKHMINTIDDFKGFRIRIMQSVVFQKQFQALGADATPMDWGELYTALQQGTVDGQENPYSQILSSNIWEVNPIIIQSEHTFTPAVFMMSPYVADKLGESQMNAILECAKEATKFFRDSAQGINAAALKALRDEKHCTVVDNLSKSELQARTAGVYDEFPQYADLVAKIRAAR